MTGKMHFNIAKKLLHFLRVLPLIKTNDKCDPGPQKQFLIRWGIFVTIVKNALYESIFDFSLLCQKSLGY